MSILAFLWRYEIIGENLGPKSIDGKDFAYDNLSRWNSCTFIYVLNLLYHSFLLILHDLGLREWMHKCIYLFFFFCRRIWFRTFDLFELWKPPAPFKLIAACDNFGDIGGWMVQERLQASRFWGELLWKFRWCWCCFQGFGSESLATSLPMFSSKHFILVFSQKSMWWIWSYLVWSLSALAVAGASCNREERGATNIHECIWTDLNVERARSRQFVRPGAGSDVQLNFNYFSWQCK